MTDVHVAGGSDCNNVRKVCKHLIDAHANCIRTMCKLTKPLLARKWIYLESNRAVVLALGVLVKVQLDQLLARQQLASHWIAFILLYEWNDVPVGWHLVGKPRAYYINRKGVCMHTKYRKHSPVETTLDPQMVGRTERSNQTREACRECARSCASFRHSRFAIPNV